MAIVQWLDSKICKSSLSAENKQFNVNINNNLTSQANFIALSHKHWPFLK